MYVRLGFSIAAHLEPDILIIDEALSVGDLRFTIRSFNRIAELLANGVSAVFVTHHLLQVQRLCSECMVLADGHPVAFGTPGDCVQAYTRSMSQANSETAHSLRTGERPDIIESYALQGADGLAPGELKSGDPVAFLVTMDTRGERLAPVHFEVRIWKQDQLVQVLDTAGFREWDTALHGRRTLRLELPAIVLAPGFYQLAFGLVTESRDRYIDWFGRHLALTVTGDTNSVAIVDTPYAVIVDSDDGAGA